MKLKNVKHKKIKRQTVIIIIIIILYSVYNAR